MEEKKKATPRKKPVAKKKTPEIISYAIRMVIPTVAYGNIQPEIVVKANSLEEAHDFIVPHMNKLWKEYYLVDGKRPIKEPIKKEPTKPEVVKPISFAINQEEKTSPISSVALIKATQAISSCLSLEVLDLITKQVKNSVKLTAEDKEVLKPKLESRKKELNGK